MNDVSSILRTISDTLKYPVIIILILLLLLSLICLGNFIAEFFKDRLKFKVDLPKLLNKIENDDLIETIKKSNLLNKHKKMIIDLVENSSSQTVEILSENLIDNLSNYYNKIVNLTDIIAKIAPMFGLLGTLIPLGPGIIALGQGDTYSLSTSLLTAFDTTIVGLISAAIAVVISTIRKNWYKTYMETFEVVVDTIVCKLGD